MKDILLSLPQIGVIAHEDAERWISGIQRWHKERASWHAKRLRGIGGSEIGAVIRGLNGLKEPGFGTLSRVVESKLMKRLPDRQTFHMHRGTVLEHLARLAFLYRYSAEQDHAALRAMDAVQKVRPGYEWLVGNPDDLVTLSGKRLLNDYKVPSSYDDLIEHDYDAQLHHYALNAQMKGIKVDGLLLTKLDLAPEIAVSLVERVPTMTGAELDELARSIARTNVPGFRVVAHVVEQRREMQLDILDCGAHCWNEMVLKGAVPDMGKAAKLELDDEILLDVARLQQQYAMAKAGVSHLNRVISEVGQEISDRLSGVDLKGKDLPLSIVNVKSSDLDKEKVIGEALARGANESELQSEKKGYSVLALLEEIKRLGGDHEAAHLYEKSLDPQKAEAYLSNLGVDLDDFLKPGVTLRMSTKKKDKEVIEAFEASASEAFDTWFRNNLIGTEPDEMEIVTTGTEAATGTFQEFFADPVGDIEDECEPNRPTKISAGMR